MIGKLERSHQEVISSIMSYDKKKVKIGVVDIDGVLRGKVIHQDKFRTVVEGSFGFCDVVFGWDCADLLYDNVDFTGWHTGYPDATAQLDLGTYRQIPWEDDLPFVLGDFTNEQGKALPMCPRSLLKSIRQQAHDMGFSPVFAQEFEWFNFRETSANLHERNFNQPEPISKGMFGYSIHRASQNSPYFQDIFDQLLAYGIPLEGLHTETGPGVYEAAIFYADILEAADRAVLFKAAVKEIAHRHGILPSFMAKWSSQFPGCGGHIHQSLWDTKATKNVFFDVSDDQRMSETMRHYVAGLLYCLPEILPMYAPTINSYKRLVPGAWAPTTLTWGVDNRTVAIRVLPGTEKSTRLEFRVPGSDVNPYLAMAASLAAGLYGIRNKLPLPSEAVTGNGYEVNGNGVLPVNLWDATQKMNSSKLAHELFGKSFVNHFCLTREWEWRKYAEAITDWELRRYFEIV